MRIVILTGAGISAESGVPTFRDAKGMWQGYEVDEVATPRAFAARPDIVHAFYDARRASLQTVEPNAAHAALVRLEERFGDKLLVVTQNVDDLHERAGSTRVVHMHGQLRSALCADCDTRFPWTGPLADGPDCLSCGVPALRPDVVWFDEEPYEMDRIFAALDDADLFVSIGTSGAVYPAAGFVQYAAARGARTLELNLEPSDGTTWFHEARHGRATVLVPEWVDQLLGG
jgi:NAD-dependent deacetylase